MDDKGSNALQLAHYGLGVLQCEGQMLPFLQYQPRSRRPKVADTVTKLLTQSHWYNVAAACSECHPIIVDTDAVVHNGNGLL